MGIGTSELFNVTLPMIKRNNIQSICMIGKQDLLIEKDKIRYYLEHLNESGSQSPTLCVADKNY